MDEQKAQQQTDIILGKTEIEPKTEIQTTPQTFISQAISQGLSIEHLEKLMNLQERWEANQARKLFFEALSNFQSNCPTLEKTKLVSFGTTKYKYAPLGEIATTIKESMNNAGLSHRWEMIDETDLITCTCIISHVSGHSEKTSMSAKKDNSGGKNEIQSRGSTITYLQRYTLIAALGISTADEDNDATTVNEKQQHREEPMKSSSKQEPPKVESPKMEVANPKTGIEATRTMKELANVWAALTAKQKKDSASVKDAQKEKIRLSIITTPISETDSIFDIEDKLKMLNTKIEVENFIRLNMKTLDELNNTNINKQILHLQNTLI